jgi:hypothetical protein
MCANYHSPGVKAMVRANAMMRAFYLKIPERRFAVPPKKRMKILAENPVEFKQKKKCWQPRVWGAKFL